MAIKNLEKYEKLTVNDLLELAPFMRIRERVRQGSGREDYIDYEIMSKPRKTKNKSETFVQFGARIISASFPCSTTATLTFFCNKDYPDLYRKVR